MSRLSKDGKGGGKSFDEMFSLLVFFMILAGFVAGILFTVLLNIAID